MTIKVFLSRFVHLLFIVVRYIVCGVIVSVAVQPEVLHACLSTIFKGRGDNHMYAGLYFTHIAGLSVWFGALVILMLLLRGARVPGEQQKLAAVLTKGKVWPTLQAAAAAVLASGIGLMITAGMIGKSKPLWLKLMEEAGGMVALLFVILVTWLARSMRKALKEENETRFAPIIKRLTAVTVTSAAAIAAVVLIVSLRLT
ncbi:hypothetical protein KDJ56_01745 [Brevibacillus composti]|uniref:DUF2269 family protein n=1 Tax=Brevibacillus composti TaxID=2796470 RepID=A0ABX7Z6D9_9BACL|nr:FTR1 family protein [Brevibacillus composti]QUO41820.1 hypothetical protein KDJ56_01745 [Brevibacillus composti]